MRKTLDLTKIHEQPKEKKQVINEEQDTSHLPRTAFTLQQADAAWKLYGSEVKESNFKAGLIVNSSILELNGEKIIINVENYIQQKQLLDFRDDVTIFIREKLNNFGITIDSAIKTSKETKQATLTSQQKFNMLSEKHPALKKLKDLLQLEINH